MRPKIKIEIYNDDLLYKWSSNKARRKRRVRIQKAKRSIKRKTRENLKKYRNKNINSLDFYSNF